MSVLTPKITQEQARKYAIYTVVAGWLAVFSMFTYRSSFSVMQGLMMSENGWTSTQATMGYSLMMVVYAIASYCCGNVVDKYGAKVSYSIAGIGCFLGFVVTSYTTSYYSYLVSYVIIAGIGTGFLSITRAVSVRKWWTGAKYGLAYGLSFMGGPVGQILSSVVLIGVLREMSWRDGMRIMGVITGIFLLISVFFVKKFPPYYGVQPIGTGTAGRKMLATPRTCTLKEAP